MLDISKLEKMAKFRVAEGEMGKMAERLNFLAEDFGKLASAPTDDVAPLIYGTDDTGVWREDIAFKEIDRETLLSNAPDHENGYFKVPKTID